MIRLALCNGWRVFVTAEGPLGYCREISRYRQHEDGRLSFITEDREYYRYGDPGLTWTVSRQVEDSAPYDGRVL